MCKRSTCESFSSHKRTGISGSCFLHFQCKAIDLPVDALKDTNNINSVKSRTGFLLTFTGVPLLWKLSLQTLIALSSQEWEYITLSTGMRSLVHLQSLFLEICSKFNLTYGNQISTISTVFEDIQAAKILATTDPPCLTPRSKQIVIRFHWFCSHLGIKDGNGIVIKDVASALNKVDLLMKALAQEYFRRNRLAVSGW